MRIFRIVLMVLGLYGLLILGIRCSGQELPDAPSRYPRAWFVLEASVLTVANYEDGKSTIRAQREGYDETSTPWLLGRHPSTGRYVAVYGSLELATVFISWKLEGNRRKWVRMVGHGLMWGSIGGHSKGYFQNLNLEH